MQIEGTKEAFMSLVKQRGFAGRSGIDKTLVSLWSSGKRTPTLDKMEEVLVSVGASVVQEKVWEINVYQGEIQFTKSQADRIKRALDERLHLSSAAQKRIRESLLRKTLGFYISDFSKNHGFSSKDFDNLVEEGFIIII